MIFFFQKDGIEIANSANFSKNENLFFAFLKNYYNTYYYITFKQSRVLRTTSKNWYKNIWIIRVTKT